MKAASVNVDLVWEGTNVTDANQAIGAYPGSVLDILAVYVSSWTCMIVL